MGLVVHIAHPACTSKFRRDGHHPKSINHSSHQQPMTRHPPPLVAHSRWRAGTRTFHLPRLAFRRSLDALSPPHLPYLKTQRPCLDADINTTDTRAHSSGEHRFSKTHPRVQSFFVSPPIRQQEKTTHQQICWRAGWSLSQWISRPFLLNGVGVSTRAKSSLLLSLRLYNVQLG